MQLVAAICSWMFLELRLTICNPSGGPRPAPDIHEAVNKDLEGLSEGVQPVFSSREPIALCDT